MLLNRRHLFFSFLLFLIIIFFIVINFNHYKSNDYYFSIDSNNLERSYIVHLPSAYEKNKSWPVVFNFHGGGGNPNNHMKITKMNSQSDASGFIVVYPAGTGLFENKFLTWNAGACCSSGDFKNVDDVKFVEDMIAKLSSDFNIDDKRIYAIGWSNGGMMANTLACRLSDKIAAIGLVGATTAIDDCQTDRPVSVIQIHGKLDPCVPYEDSYECGGCFDKLIDRKAKTFSCMPAKELEIDWLKRNNCGSEKTTVYENGGANCQSYLCDNKSEVQFCLIDGAGHIWPGGDKNALSDNYFEVAGIDTGELNANEVIWNFLKNKTL